MNIKRLNSDKGEDKLSDLIERVDKVRENDELHSLVKESKEKYGVRNISFAGFNLGTLTLIEPVSVWTYKPEWIDHYRRKNYLDVDPVVKTVPTSILPVDWSQFDRHSFRKPMTQALAITAYRFRCVAEMESFQSSA